MSWSLYYVFVVFGVVVAILFTLLVFFTGKGDAMSGGGGSIRTTFKGRATFDDQISRVTVILGLVFMGLMLLLDWAAHQLPQR